MSDNAHGDSASNGDSAAGNDFVVIGAGAVASALAPALVAAGYRCRGIADRDRKRVASLAGAVDCAVVDVAPGASLTCLCVPDDAIHGVAHDLATRVQDWTGRTVLHVSGSHGARVLDPLAERGAVVLAFHPVQTFVYPSSADVMAGIAVGISGPRAGIEAGRLIADRLGMRPVAIDESDRPLYHLATALASNGVVTLSALAHEVLSACGLDAESSRAMLAPLIVASSRNLVDDLPASVLTGPVVRGDERTVDAHLAAVQDRAPHLLPVLAALTSETIRLAVRSGRLDRMAAERMLDVLAGLMRAE